MKLGVCIGIVCAGLLHIGFLLFGGLFFMKDEQDHGTLQQVELLSDDEVSEEQKEPEEQITEATEQTEAEDAPPSEVSEVVRGLDMTDVADAPALEAASLSAIEAALSGQSGGGGDFAQALGFASGGRIGGTGSVGAVGGTAQDPFAMDDVDQAPRLVVQVLPLYPSEMRGKKVEGLVSVAFVVDADGKVSNPRVDETSHAAFSKPALEAVKKWKFEPALRDGKRVPKKMRVPIRFPIPS
ncbi:MAG: energy transducer TonB [Planctomycetota bacterium]